MTDRILSPGHLIPFREYLLREEKSAATVEKYLRDAGAFVTFADNRPITKELTVAFKQSLKERQYAVRSINSMLASLNSLLNFLGWTDCKVKTLRCQRQTYCAADKELSKAEYLRLLEASRKQVQLNLVMQTICGTGIRVSELRYFTVEAVRRGEITVCCKSKTRTILVPGKLKKLLCEAAGVAPSKVFPHNLRKLFARTFYGIEKDIAKLADILGHGSVETTRIYIMTSGTEHRRKMERLGLII